MAALEDNLNSLAEAVVRLATVARSLLATNVTQTTEISNLKEEMAAISTKLADATAEISEGTEVSGNLTNELNALAEELATAIPARNSFQ